MARNGIRRIDCPIKTPDGYSVSAHLDLFGRVSITKSCTPDFSQTKRPDRITLFPKRLPEASCTFPPTRIVAPPYRSHYAHRMNIRFEYPQHAQGLDSSLFDLRNMARLAGWDQSAIEQLFECVDRLGRLPKNVPGLREKLSRTISVVVPSTGYVLKARRNNKGIVLIQTAQNGAVRSQDAPDVQTLSGDFVLNAENFELIPGRAPALIKVRTKTNETLFADTLNEGLTELVGKAEANYFWSPSDISSLMDLARDFSASHPNLSTATGLSQIQGSAPQL